MSTHPKGVRLSSSVPEWTDLLGGRDGDCLNQSDPFTGERSVSPADQREVCGAFGHTFLAGGFTRGVRNDRPAARGNGHRQPGPRGQGLLRGDWTGATVTAVASPPSAGVPYWPTVEPEATRPKAWAGDGCQGPWTRDDERAFGTPSGRTVGVTPAQRRPVCVGVIAVAVRPERSSTPEDGWARVQAGGRPSVGVL